MSRSALPATARTPEEWRSLAKGEYGKKEESFQRCDTDGFLSQWAHGLTAQLYEAKAAIAEADGLAGFPALFNLDGERVRAKLIDTKYGLRWAVLGDSPPVDGYGLDIVKWVAYSPKRESTLAKYGLKEGREMAPAEAGYRSTGTGLSGQCWVATYRTDGGFPPDAITHTFPKGSL